MNAVEKLEAAIAELEELKANAKPGPWEIRETDSPWRRVVRVLHPKIHPDDEEYDRNLVVDGPHAEDSGGLRPEDAALIVTLHRTIDAQLAILRTAIADYRMYGREPSIYLPFDVAVTSLADAILGGGPNE